MAGPRIRVRLFGREARELELGRRMRIIDVLDMLNVNVEEVVVLRNGELVPEDAYVDDGDELEVIAVIPGIEDEVLPLRR